MHLTLASRIQQNVTWKSYQISFIIVARGFHETVCNSIKQYLFIIIKFFSPDQLVTEHGLPPHWEYGQSLTKKKPKENKQTNNQTKRNLKPLPNFITILDFKMILQGSEEGSVLAHWAMLCPMILNLLFTFIEMGLVMLHVCLQIFQCFNYFSTFSPQILKFSNLMTVN